MDGRGEVPQENWGKMILIVIATPAQAGGSNPVWIAASPAAPRN